MASPPAPTPSPEALRMIHRVFPSSFLTPMSSTCPQTASGTSKRGHCHPDVIWGRSDLGQHPPQGCTAQQKAAGDLAQPRAFRSLPAPSSHLPPPPPPPTPPPPSPTSSSSLPSPSSSPSLTANTLERPEGHFYVLFIPYFPLVIRFKCSGTNSEG